MSIPAELKYSKEHEWVKALDDNTAIIGITDFAQGELGELVYVEVETVGEELAKEEIFGTVEAVKTTSDLFMPVSGKSFHSIPNWMKNEGDNPGVINTDPYGAGWVIKIELTNPSELDDLLDASAYEELTQ